MSEIKKLSPEEFRKMQLLQTEMLVEFDRVCRENDIQYSICGGTMLGAIRHKGYIPWDDDADLALLREDYEKFKKVADQLNPEICWFQDHSTDPHYRWGYGKLRKTGTEYIRAGQEHLKCKTGVFVDVFPFDDVPKSVLGQMLQEFKCFVLRKALWSEVGKLDPKVKGFEKLFYKAASRVPLTRVFRKIEKIAAKSRNNSENKVRILMFTAVGKICKRQPLKERYGYTKKWITETKDYEFEGHILQGTAAADDYLTYLYGDYMQLPPEDQRDPHAPVSSYRF